MMMTMMVVTIIKRQKIRKQYSLYKITDEATIWHQTSKVFWTSKVHHCCNKCILPQAILSSLHNHNLIFLRFILGVFSYLFHGLTRNQFLLRIPIQILYVILLINCMWVWISSYAC
jgi:hypothetical protein